MTTVLKFGVFDHLDDSGRPLAEQYANRLRLIEAYDRAGFHAYHLAEHHGTPHGLAPSPNLFLAAAAQRTRRLRLGPMVMLLNLYHPLRAIEEICMLDQLSGGRLELGIGRGGVPMELGFFGVVPQDAQGRYQEVSDIVLKAMRGGTLSHHGRFFDINAVPLVLSPVQRPRPSLWYGAVKPATAAWAAENGMNIACLGTSETIRRMTDTYRATRAAAQPRHGAMPLLGMVRFVVIGRTDQEARDLAGPAYARWYDTLTQLWRSHGVPAPYELTADLDQVIAAGHGLVGAVATVRDAIARQAVEAGVTYLMCQVAFGDLPVEATLRTVHALRTEIMPNFAGPMRINATSRHAA